MLGNKSIRKLVTLATMVAVWSVYSMVAIAAPNGSVAEISITGQVTVNGQAVVSNSVLMSGSTIVTGPDSTATISLGKTGRIEVLGGSNINLQFTDTSIVGIISIGKVRVSSAAGVATTITSKDAVAIADAGQADTFVVEVECSHTHVDGVAGVVTMREGTSDKQIVAGSTAVAGNLEQTGCQPCLRPGSAPPLAFASPWWIALIAAGAVGIFFLKHNETDIGGTTVIVSPTR
ncbi:MAG TPA: hypothetical protein VEV84_02420 [Pyrinomonadaceae bacterium]|jgi:hypothetical protein|nr:hypothetical protein [Pyrinomonadaceae bacterium]